METRQGNKVKKSKGPALSIACHSAVVTSWVTQAGARPSTRSSNVLLQRIKTRTTWCQSIKTLYSKWWLTASPPTSITVNPKNKSAYDDVFCHFRRGRPLITWAPACSDTLALTEERMERKSPQHSSPWVRAHPTLMCSIPRRAAGVNGSQVTSLCWWLMPLLTHPLVWQQQQLNNASMPLVLTTACRWKGTQGFFFYFVSLLFFSTVSGVSFSSKGRRNQCVPSRRNSGDEPWNPFPIFDFVPFLNLFLEARFLLRPPLSC